MSTKIQVFTSSGTFNVPSTVSCVRVTEIAAGAGSDPWPSSSGGSGGYAIRMPVKVTPGGTLSITVGAGGVGAVGGSPGTATDGGNSVVDWIITAGGIHAGATGSLQSGSGGGANSGGFALTNEDGIAAGEKYNGPIVCNVTGSTPVANVGCYGGSGNGGCTGFWGGTSGGGAGGAAKPTGNYGGPSVNGNTGGLPGGTWDGVSCANGAGGASTPWGIGPQGGNSAGSFAGVNATSPGCSGSAGTCNGLNTNAGQGGNGFRGEVWIEY